MSLKNTIEKSFATYAAMTIQHRAIIDARDALKPGQRMAFYAQSVDKLVWPKPHKKTHKSVVSAMDHFYVHGDASMIDLLCRLARPMSMRYCLEDGVGNMGTYTQLTNFAAPRYTEMRLGQLGVKMVEGTHKETIERWFDNYDNTEQFPSVLPSLGYYNIVNGSIGIATSLSTSIPQFNLREVNEAMIKLLWNPDIDFDEIYCAPDFTTGGTILNADEVKESLRNGKGKSIIIRGTLEYDSDDNSIRVKEVPYNVATGSVKKEIAGMFESEKKPFPAKGIARFTDSSEEMVDMTIWLEKGVNPESVVRNLYKYTRLQTFFPINMIMLDKGTRPKLFTWREALNAHLDHEKEVRTKIHELELRKIDERLPIVEAITIALANVDEVIEIIRGAEDGTNSKTKLMERFGYTDAQANAVLAITLKKLTKLEIQSFNDEKEKLLAEKEYHVAVLNDKDLLYKEIEKDLREIAEKFGDERRTKLMNLDYKNSDEDAEPVERKELLITYTNLGNIYAQETTTLIAQKRGGKGTNFKLKTDEYVTQSISTDNMGWLYAFTNKGKMYSVMTDSITLGRNNASVLFGLEAGEKISYINTFSKKSAGNYFYFITKDGMIKKTAVSEYKSQKKGIIAIKLKDGDEVVTVFAANGGNIGVLSSSGKFIVFDGSEVSDTGRNTAGVRAIKLKDGESVISAAKIMGDNLVTVTEYGMVKKTSMSEFNTQGRGGTGVSISGVSTNDRVVDFLTFKEDCDIMIISSKKNIKIPSTQISTQSRTGKGSKGITLDEKEKVKSIVKA